MKRHQNRRTDASPGDLSTTILLFEDAAFIPPSELAKLLDELQEDVKKLADRLRKEKR